MVKITVILTLAVLAIFKTSADCPDDPEAAVVDCTKGIVAFYEATDEQSRREQCPIAYNALECVENTLKDCAGSSMLANMPMPLDALITHVRDSRRQLDNLCQNTTNADRCPNPQAMQMQCAQIGMNYHTAPDPETRQQFCPLAFQELACYENIMDQCRGHEDFVFNKGLEAGMQHWREDLYNRCTSGGPENLSSCPSDVYVRMAQCSRGIENFLEAEDRESECGTAHASLNCYADLFHRCQGNREMNEIIESFDLESLRSSLSLFCK